MHNNVETAIDKTKSRQYYLHLILQQHCQEFEFGTQDASIVGHTSPGRGPTGARR